MTFPDIASGLPVAGMMLSLQTSSASGQAIVAVLFVGSILTWSFMIVKWRELGEAGRASQRFIDEYRRAAHPFTLFLRKSRSAAHPVAVVYAAVCAEAEKMIAVGGADPNAVFMGGATAARNTLDAQRMAAVRSMVERAVTERSMLLESRMGLLATATTTAPFLGLLGTVWGVMDTFAAMSVKGTAMLSAVAPGISGALLTTVIGLLVALPSAIGYNMLSERIRQLTVRTDQFAQELAADIERHCCL